MFDYAGLLWGRFISLVEAHYFLKHISVGYDDYFFCYRYAYHIFMCNLP